MSHGELWMCGTLGEYVDLVGGFGFPNRFQGSRTGDLPFYKVSDMSIAGNDRWLLDANNYVSHEMAARNGWRTAPAGGVAFAKVGAALLLNRRRVLLQESLVDNNMMVAVPRAGLHTGFLYWYLQTVDFSDFVQPGALPSVNQGQISSLTVNFPPLPEQRRIAEILDTLDEAIHKTEKVIAKLQQMKQGLLHDLLTCGLDENGELRDPERHPEQFKDSPLGRIPREWEADRLGNLLILMRNGTTAPQQGHPTPYPVTRIETIAEGVIDLTRVGYLRQEEPAYEMEPGDILFSHINSYDHIGKVALYNDAVRLYHGMNLMLLRANRDVVSPEYLHALLASEFGRAYARRECKSAINQASLSQVELKRFTLARPPLEEQLVIVSYMEALNDAIVKEGILVSKLRLLKQGLMDDLLTGRVRVPVAEEVSS